MDTITELTPEALVDLEIPRDVQLSPTGNHVVYCTSPAGKKDEHPVSSIWWAEVGKEHSARQLTSGLYNDESPQFRPDDTSIAFLSDRAERGKTSAIYVLPIGGGEPYYLTNKDNKKKISKLAWSPNGQFITFNSPDEKSKEQEDREAETGGAKVYGETWDYNRLRCLHVATRRISTLVSVDADIFDFAWKEDSTEIAYITQKTPEIDSSYYHGLEFSRVNVARGTQNLISAFPGEASSLVWAGEKLYFLAGVSTSKANTSSTLYSMDFKEGQWRRQTHSNDTCAVGLRRSGQGQIGILTQCGLYDSIWGGSDILYESPHKISTWDSLVTEDEKVLTIGKSMASSPTEIYSFNRSDPCAELCQLSQHGSAIASLEISSASPIHTLSPDGQSCDSIFLRPHCSDPKKALPTAVLVHGGPYSRVAEGFNLPFFYWAPYLVSAGYAVLCPNYRGGSSHGESYASAARGGMGTTDYDDVIALVKKGIEQGLIDGERVGIGGWSQGGFLSYLAVTRDDFKFKAAVCGAGVTDWDMLNMSSDAPFFEAELAGKAPWECDEENTKGRHGSAIWHMDKIKTPILILHGEDDERIPLSQAVAFHRGCLHYGVPCEFVTYPREPHAISERKHLVDMLKRMRRFFDMHLA